MKPASHRPHRRRGYTLVEVLVYLSVIATVTGATTVTLHGMFRFNQQARDRLNLTRARDRVARQFREDVRGGVEAPRLSDESDGETAVLTLTLGDGSQVEYLDAGGQLRRTVSTEGRVAHRDHFQLPAGSTTRWRMDAESGLLEMTLIGEDGKPQSHVLARAGADHRFASEGGTAP